VKSLRGLTVQSAAVDPLGAVGDRRFLWWTGGNFLTQRTSPGWRSSGRCSTIQR